MGTDERDRIIGSAWTVLERSGFEGFKVMLVMRDADVSARSFYRHFADKDALLVALIQDEMARAAARLDAAVARADGPVEQVRAWVRGVIGAAGDPRRVARARLFTSQQPVLREHADEVAAATDLLVRPLRDAIRLGVETGAFPWARPARDATLIYGLTGSELNRALSETHDRTIENAIHDAAEFALRALGMEPDRF